MHARFLSYLLILTLLISPSTSRADNNTDTALMNTAIIATTLSWLAVAWQDPAALKTPFLTSPVRHAGLTVGQASQVSALTLFAGSAFGYPLLQGANWQLAGHWEFSLTRWHADRRSRKNPDGWMFGITPVLQYQWLRAGWQPYLELGIGLRYLSDIQVADQYKSTRFQFGDLVGIGLMQGHWQLGLRYLHVSNANIEVPNPGTNFYTLKVDYRF